MKIILTGSLGHISKPLTQILVQKGHSVTVITSKAERQKDIESLGAKAAIGIMEDVDFLAGATRLFGVRYLNRPSLCYRVWPSMMHSQKDLEAALKRSYLRLQASYRDRFGTFDFYTLKIAARTLLRFI